MDRVLLLRTIPVFEGLGPVQLAAIAQHAVERNAARGSIVEISTGDGGSILLVVEGKLNRVGLASEPSFAKGGSAGLIEMLAGTDTELAFEAAVDTMLLELGRDEQLDVCEEHFGVTMSYLAFLASQLVECTQTLAPGGFGPVPLIAAQRFSKPLDVNERLLLLSRSGAFSPGCLDALSELSHHAEELRLRKGKRIWSASEQADSFVLIASGALRLEDRSGGFAVYKAGMAAGLAESLSPYYRRFSAVSIEPTVALRIPIEAFMDILEDHFDLSLDVMSMLARRLLALSETNASPPGHIVHR